MLKKFNIGETTIKQWVHQYNAGGVTQLINVNRRYSTEFKKNVIEYKWEYGLSLNETTAHFKIPSAGTVFQWEKRYLEEGISRLMQRKKGRLCNMMPKKPKTPKKPRELTREQEMEAEIAQLKMENAFPKKIERLGSSAEKATKKELAIVVFEPQGAISAQSTARVCQTGQEHILCNIKSSQQTRQICRS